MKEVHNYRLLTGMLLVLVVGMCLACGGNQTNGTSTAQQADTPQTAEKKAPLLTAGMKAGEAVYEQYCMTCHQANGKGVSSLNPPLAGTEYVTGDKNRLIKIVLSGSNVGLEVNGMVYSNAMPPHAFLGDEEIANVLSYIRNSFGNATDTVSADEVKAVRAAL